MGGFTSKEGYEQFQAQMEKISNNKPKDSAVRLGGKLESRENDNSEKIIQELKDKLGINAYKEGKKIKFKLPEEADKTVILNGEKMKIASNAINLDTTDTVTNIVNDKSGYRTIEVTDKNGVKSSVQFYKSFFSQSNESSEQKSELPNIKGAKELQKTLSDYKIDGVSFDKDGISLSKFGFDVKIDGQNYNSGNGANIDLKDEPGTPPIVEYRNISISKNWGPKDIYFTAVFNDGTQNKVHIKQKDPRIK